MGTGIKSVYVKLDLRTYIVGTWLWSFLGLKLDIGDQDLSSTIAYISVCCSPQCPAVAGLHVVRGSSRVQADEHDPPGPRDLQDRSPLPHLLAVLHRLSLGHILTGHEETFH